MQFEYVAFLLPIVFMIHDFEEIIFFKWWLNRNSDIISQKFPRIAKIILPHLQKLTTAGFALAVAEEFFLISVITFLAVIYRSYTLWFAVFSAFSLHLLLHIIQWIVLRRYLPSIVTAVLLLPYCFYALRRFVDEGGLLFHEMVLWCFIGIILMVGNLFFAHRLAKNLTIN